MAEQRLKPVGYLPNGWHFRAVFIDDDGSVFRKGIHFPEDKGTIEETSRQTDEAKNAPKEQEKQENSEQEQSPGSSEAPESKAETTTETTTDPVVALGLSEEAVDSLRSYFTDDLVKKNKKMMEEFMASMETKTQEGVSQVGMSVNDIAQAMALSEQYKVGGRHYRSLKDISPEDYDEKGATFTCYGNGYLIVDDVRKGHPVTTPYGRIFKFRFQASRITKIGRVENYSSFCSFRTTSKKEIEWLRTHSLYNIEFYEDTKLALNADAYKVTAAAKIYRQISSLNQTQVLERAKRYNIKIGGDMRDIISQLALAMAEEEVSRMEEEAKGRTVEAFEKKTFA